MRKALTIPAIIVALYVPQAVAAHAETCQADNHGGLTCGEGSSAMRVIAGTTSPSGKFAFAWRTAQGLPPDDKFPSGEVENLLVRLSDGAVLAKLGGAYWDTGTIRVNRYEVVAAWSSDSRAVIEVSNNRWDTYSLAYYALDREGKATALDLRALIEPALKTKLPSGKRERYSFRVREELPVKLGPHGQAQFIAMLYVPKAETSLDYSVRVGFTSKHGQPTARIASLQRVRAK